MESLIEYWNDEKRAKKFTKGGTRTPGIDYIIARLETDVHKGVWVDLACGAGFVQTRLSESVHPNAVIGLDFSRIMLDLISEEEVLRVLGSTFSPPFRNESANLATNFFNLSDYPKIVLAFDKISKIVKTGGIFGHLDYAKTDEYWQQRIDKHGEKNKHDEIIVGNIHLRTLDDIKDMIPDRLRITFQKLIEYEVDGTEVSEKLEIEGKVKRSFIYTETYKPRSLQDI